MRRRKLQGLSRDGLHHALEFLYCARLQPKSLDEFSEALLAAWTPTRRRKEARGLWSAEEHIVERIWVPIKTSLL